MLVLLIVDLFSFWPHLTRQTDRLHVTVCRSAHCTKLHLTVLLSGFINLVSPAHTFSDQCRWCAPKGAVSRITLANFPPKLKVPIITTDGSSLWLEWLFSEDKNTVSKLFCIICFMCPVTCSAQVYSCLCGRCTGQLLLTDLRWKSQVIFFYIPASSAL